MTVRLTQFSHGAGCGCKVAPDVLDQILHTSTPGFADPRLLVGNDSRDDAAVVDIGSGMGIISTTDFFMPVVDSPYDFGRIASSNAISDVYAMGGTPIMAIAILGWPIDRLAPDIAGKVIYGARAVCAEAGIAVAGGHSIDSPEPIFGLAVTGRVAVEKVLRNNTACAGDLLYLTKPLGIGIITSAVRKGQVSEQDLECAVESMVQLNRAGETFAGIEGVHAMTDVTGFGLLGHLLEICRACNLQARLHRNAVPVLPNLAGYISGGCVPGGTHRNVAAYGAEVSGMTEYDKLVFCDPQTSGGLLVAVVPQHQASFEQLAASQNQACHRIGQLMHPDGGTARVHVTD